MTLYALTCGGPDLAARVRAVRGAGAIVLVRELELDPELAQPGVILHARMPGAEALAAARGLGLHLPGGADVAAVRARFPGPLGYSAHSVAEAHAARAAGADVVFLSPIWAPTSKPGRPPLGPLHLDGLVALGGVTVARVAECRGAAGVAVLGGIFGQPGREVDATRAYLTALQKLKTSSS